jgi:hypothetical protein
MAIAITYIGQRRFQKTSEKNHRNFFELLQSKYKIKIYDFIKDAVDPNCPFTSSGGVQVWDFLKAKDNITEDIFIKIRTDVWITKSAETVILTYLDKVVSGELDMAFFGLDFLNCCNLICYEQPVQGLKKITDFIIIAKKSAIVENKIVINQLTGPKHKSGNQMFRAVFNPESVKAVTVSCQLYLLRKDYTVFDNWKMYKEWTDEYHKSKESQAWVASNAEIIRTF